MSLLQMLKYSGLFGQVLVIVGSVGGLLTVIALIRAVQAARVMIGSEGGRAVRRLERGEPAAGVVAEWQLATDSLARWPHGLLVIAALAILLGAFGTVTGLIAMNHAIATATGTAPSPADVAGGHAQALTTLTLGLGVASLAMLAYGALAMVFSGIAFVGRHKVLSARRLS